MYTDRCYCSHRCVVFTSLFHLNVRRNEVNEEKKRNCFIFVSYHIVSYRTIVVFAFNVCHTVLEDSLSLSQAHTYTRQTIFFFFKMKKRPRFGKNFGFRMSASSFCFILGAEQTHDIYSYLSRWQTIKEFFHPKTIALSRCMLCAVLSGAVSNRAVTTDNHR